MSTTPKIISFTRVRLPNGWLGNMAPHPIVHGELTWRTPEALFQALRFADDDDTVRYAIWTATSPMAAKMEAKKHIGRMVVIPRSPNDVELMRGVLRLKLEQHPRVREDLAATAGSTIIENCTSRANVSGLFWGAALVDGAWIGENRLGRMWMELRDA